MRFPWHILIIFLLPLAGFSQNSVISGKITVSGTKTPVPRATVFLSNSSIGSASLEDGTFILSPVRQGQYTLIVKILGYEEYSKVVLVGREPLRIEIGLTPKPMMLREVVISSAADWKKNYDIFRREFIGSDLNAKNCVVMNPHILNITYNPTRRVLHADADEFLVVENHALGYRVKFLLNDFRIDNIAGIISSSGERVFEELPGSEAQKKKWHQNREEVYYGSAMHFYRSLYSDKLTKEGFAAYDLKRELNPERPDDEVIRRKAKMYAEHGMRDSLRYMNELIKMSKYHNENLQKIPYQEFEIVSTVSTGIYALHFLHYLYVVYTKKMEQTDFKDIYRPLDKPNYQTSVITLQGEPIVFDMNGIVVQGSPLYEGTWSKSRLSDMLPVNYVPDEN